MLLQMSHPQKRPKFYYTEEAMEAAVRAVRDEGNPFADSKRFNVPRSTLINKVTGVLALGRKMGPESTLGKDIEKLLLIG